MKCVVMDSLFNKIWYNWLLQNYKITKLGEISKFEAEIGNHIVLIAEMRFGLSTYNFKMI